MNQLALELEGVSKSFGGVHALRDVSISIEGPAITGLIGPNGSGKSTLLGVLSGLVVPTSGAVRFQGRELPLGSPRRIARLGVSRGFQSARLIAELRVWENIAFGLGESRRRRALRQRSREIAELLDLGHAVDRWPSDLTAAERRRLQVGSAIATGPQILLLDEPAAGLTDAEGAELAEAIRRLAPESLVVLVEHNMHVVSSLASRVLVLIDGALAAVGTPNEVTADPVVQSAYLGSLRPEMSAAR